MMADVKRIVMKNLEFLKNDLQRRMKGIDNDLQGNSQNWNKKRRKRYQLVF
jgi:hypothetical protein